MTIHRKWFVRKVTRLCGQNAQRCGNPSLYTISADGLTVQDINTGLTWQRSPDTNGDGSHTASDKLTWGQAQARPKALNAVRYGGFDDWRLPTIKELYSLIDFRGTDPGAGVSTAGLTPFIDTRYFQFAYGDTRAGERIIDSQYASTTVYAAADSKVFGVNFADGRIKGYDLMMPGGLQKTFFVHCVRGPANYGTNSFLDNGDGTITDTATGLMWAQSDSGSGMNWQTAGLGAGPECRELSGLRRLAHARCQGIAEHRGLHAVSRHDAIGRHRSRVQQHSNRE